MKEIALRVDNVSKQYRLGQVGTGTLSHDLKRWTYKILGKADPYLEVGLENDRTKSAAGSDYVWAVKDVSFDVQKGDVIGIIGRNGAGKSTLLKMLSQITQITTGKIEIKGRIASLLEVGTGFHPELTGKENIYLNGAILGMRKEEISRKFDEIVEFSGCAKYIDTPVKRYSSGMMVRLGFAVAAHLDPEILVIDEVLAVGDQEFQEKCIGKMKDVASEGRTVLFVSHNMSSIRSLCNKCILLKQGQVQSIGSTDDIVAQYLKEGSSSIKKYEKGPLSEISVKCTGGVITLHAKYSTKKKLHIPALGFVILDNWGNPIFGNNPKNLGYKADSSYSNDGEISINITDPQLLDGIYRVSVWFGDGQVDFFQDRECLEFEVISEEQSKLNPSNVGYVQNKCTYEFK